jgi:hypothetical protein
MSPDKVCNMLRRTLGAAVVLAIAIGVVLPTAKAETIECHEKAETREYWTWREIDGRRCWYKGRRRVSKSLLFWAPKKSPEAIEIDLTTASSQPQVSPAESTASIEEPVESSASVEEPVEAREPPGAPVRSLGAFETTWQNLMADMKSQTRAKSVRPIGVRPLRAD